MFGKLVLLILMLGGVSAAMLVDRQQRLDLAAEMQRTHSRLRQHEQATWRLRADIAYATRPAEIRASIERLNVRMVPIPNRLEHSRSKPQPSTLAGAPGRPGAPAAAPAGRAPLLGNGAAPRVDGQSEGEYGG